VAEAVTWNSIPEMYMFAVSIILRIVLVSAVRMSFFPVPKTGEMIIVSKVMMFFAVVVMSYFAVIVMSFSTIMIVPPVVMVLISRELISPVMIPL
jgi:hypothetical protein